MSFCNSSPSGHLEKQAGVEVKLRNLNSKIKAYVGLEINVLPDSQGVEGTCKQHRSSCEEPIPQGKALPPPS